MFKRMIHPSPDQVRLTGLAAIVGGVLGVLVSPLYSLAYFAGDEAPVDTESALVQAWAEPARDLLGPLLTFASPDDVYLTYGKLFLFVWMGMLAGLVGLHARHAGRGGRLERWGFRASFLGLLLLVIGAFGAYWMELVEASFVAFLVPGLLLLTFGATLFGLGTWRAGVAPRTGALLLVVGGFPGTFLISEIATLGGGLVLVYLAWVVLGHALWSERIIVESRSPAVRTS
ncbi:MAG: hypothetical protein ACRDNX_04195 [Gaiellaceae bacterium]